VNYFCHFSDIILKQIEQAQTNNRNDQFNAMPLRIKLNTGVDSGGSGLARSDDARL